MNLKDASYCSVCSPHRSISLAGHCFPAQCCDLVFCKVVFPIIAGNDVVFFPNGERLAEILVNSFHRCCSALSGRGGQFRLCLGAAWSCARLMQEVH